MQNLKEAKIEPKEADEDPPIIISPVTAKRATYVGDVQQESVEEEKNLPESKFEPLVGHLVAPTAAAATIA